MTPDRKAKMLERVRALLAKAEGTTFPEEAESFRAKAYQLMTEYAIEQWQVDAAQDGVHKRPTPEVRQFEFGWWRTSNRSDELWDLFMSTARHCRCTVAIRGYGDRTKGGSYTTIPVIGLDSDLDFFDMLFTHLMLQMAMGLEPKVDTTETLGANALRLRSAGKGMREGKDSMAPMLWRAGMLPLTPAQQAKYPWTKPEDEFRQLPSALQKSLVGRVRRALNEEAKRVEQVLSPVHPRVWQRSYAIGFVREVGDRFWNLRMAQERAHGGSTGTMALAVRDIAKVSVDMYEDLWPTPEDTGKSRGRALTREVRVSGSAMAAGREAGARADISQPGQRLGGRKELER
jgi:hypothetical protein